jgi:hypothetical protein
MTLAYEHIFKHNEEDSAKTILSYQPWDEAKKQMDGDNFIHIETRELGEVFNQMMSDFPKLECPYVRKNYPVNAEQWLKHGNKLQLREPQAYLVTDEVTPGFEWVFEDDDTVAVEKLDGTNVKIMVRDKKVVSIQNRLNKVDLFFLGSKGTGRITEGIINAINKGFIEGDGEHAGECIGPKINGNPLQMTEHIWIPFSRTEKYLAFRSFHQHPKTFQNISTWMHLYLRSPLLIKKFGFERAPFAEGIIFYNRKRQALGLSWMAKLRRNMYPWFYWDQIDIEGLPDYWVRDHKEVVPEHLRTVTCNKCGRVHVALSRKEVVSYIRRWNEYYERCPEEERLGRSPDSIGNYEVCLGCGGSYKDFRMSETGDCPAGVTLTPVMYFKE